MKREDGYYWVKLKGFPNEWTIARQVSPDHAQHIKYWTHTYYPSAMLMDSDMLVINEYRILDPDEMENVL